MDILVREAPVWCHWFAQVANGSQDSLTKKMTLNIPLISSFQNIDSYYIGKFSD